MNEVRWMTPRKIKSNNPMVSSSRYGDIRTCEPFVLQKRKETAPRGEKHRPEFRIIWKTDGGYPYFVIAQRETFADIFQDQWKYITDDLEKEIKANYRRNLSDMSFSEQKHVFKELFAAKAEAPPRTRSEEIKESFAQSDADEEVVADEDKNDMTENSTNIDHSLHNHGDFEMFPCNYQGSNDLRRPDQEQLPWVVIVSVVLLAINVYTEAQWMKLCIGIAAYIFILSFYVFWATFVVSKVGLLLNGILCMVFGKDKSFNTKDIGYDPDQINEEYRITIIFIRHGRSKWNYIFNEGKMYVIPRLITALFEEFTMLITPDSILFDSPLDYNGVDQAKKLSNHLKRRLEEKKHDDAQENTRQMIAQILNGNQQSIITCSPLRRSIGTLIIGLQSLFKKPCEIKILSDLQEISTNVDCLSLTKPRTKPDLSFFQFTLHNVGIDLKNIIFNVDYYQTKKSNRSKGLTRLKGFADWVSKEYENKKLPIVVGGHSLWFRYFFQTFLPHKSNHILKKKKISNGGVVSFDLIIGSSSLGRKKNRVYKIDEASITPLRDTDIST